MTLADKSVDGIIWMISNKIARIILNLGILAVLARLIEPTEFGLMGAALIVIGFAKIFTQLGVGPAIVQRPELNDNHITTGFSLSLLLGLVSMLLVYLTSDILEAFFSMEGLSNILKFVSIIFLLENVLTISMSLLQRELRFKHISIISIISYVFGYGLIGILLAVSGYGVWSLVWANIAETTFLLIFSYSLVKHKIRINIDISSLKELMYFGGGFTIATVFNYIARRGDSLVVGKWLGANSLGLYDRAYSIMAMPATYLGDAFDKVLFPAMSTVQTDKKKLGDIYIKGTEILASVSLPTSIVFVMLAPEIVKVLLGEEWLGAIKPLQILSLGLVFRMGYKMSESLARAYGAVYARAWRQAIYAILIVIGTVIGQKWGLEGVTIGVLIALAVIYFLMATLSLRITNLNWKVFIKCHKYGLINSLIITLIVYPVLLYIRQYETPIFSILISSILLILYIIYLFKTNNLMLIGKSGVWTIDKFKQKIKALTN